MVNREKVCCTANISLPIAKQHFIIQLQPAGDLRAVRLSSKLLDAPGFAGIHILEEEVGLHGGFVVFAFPAALEFNKKTFRSPLTNPKSML